MAEIIWTEPALKDLQDIIRYIARDSLIYAERFGLQVVEAPKRLAQFPYCGRIVPEFKDDNIRELIYGSYRIIYFIRGGYILYHSNNSWKSRYFTAFGDRRLGRYIAVDDDMAWSNFERPIIQNKPNGERFSFQG